MNMSTRPILDGTRRLMIEIPETSPCYLTTDRSEEKSYASSSPCTQMLSLKPLPWKPSRSLGLLSMSRPHSLLDPAISAVLSFTTTGISKLALLCGGHVAGKKVGHKRMVTSQVSGESLGQPPSVGSWLCAGRQERAILKWKKVYSGRYTLHRQSVGHLRRQERHQGTGLSVFIGVGNFTGYWMGGIFQWFWGRGGDFQELGHCPLFDLYGWPWNCHDTCGRVI